MPGMIQPGYTPRHDRVITCIGDSHTYNAGYCVATEFHPHRLQTMLRTANSGVTHVALPRVKARNFGLAGDTTGQMLVRVACLTQFEVPTIVVIYGGVNDLSYDTTVQAGSTASVINVAAGFGVSYKAGTYMTINGVSRQILSVATDAVTLVTALSGAPTNGQAVSIDTQANITAIGAFAVAAGCSKILVTGTHYYNWASGGDSLATPYAPNVALRAKIVAAAAAITGGVYCDAYTYFRNLIVNGTEAQGSNSWHVFASNVHLNALGENYLALAEVASIVAAPGWVAALA